MIALPLPPVGTMERQSYCPRERRMIDRDSRDYDHARAVLTARRRFLVEHGMRVPSYIRPGGMRTVFPPRTP